MINYYGSLLADRTAKYGSPAQLQADPNAQARAAIAEFDNGAGASKWQGKDLKTGEAANPIYIAWRDAQFPQKPSHDVVASWITAKGGKPDLPGGGTTTSSITSANPNIAATPATGCEAGGKGLSFSGINIPGVSGRPGAFSGIGTACQLKALSGGLMAGLGGAVFITGAILVVAAIAGGTKTGASAKKAGASIIGTAVGGPAGGAAVNAAVGKASTSSKRTAKRSQAAGLANLGDSAEEAQTALMEQSAKQQTRQRRSNPSDKQKEYERNRRAARLALRPGETAF
jgi:hypothetical protein